MYYERIRKIGQDPRMEWLEVRGSWTLPFGRWNQQTARDFSDRRTYWGGGYYAMKPEGIQHVVQRIIREGLHGYLPAYEPGFGTASIYGERIPFPVDLIPFRLTQFYYHEFTWDPSHLTGPAPATGPSRIFSATKRRLSSRAIFSFCGN